MDKAKIKKLANKIYLEPTEDVYKQTEELYENVTNGLNKLTQFKLENYLPMNKIGKKHLSFDALRDDISNKDALMKTKDILDNAGETKDNFVALKRVIHE